MNFYILTQLISGLWAIALGIFVLKQNPHNSLYRAYSSLSFTLAAWCLSYFIWLSQIDRNTAMVWIKVVMFFNPFIHTLFLHFILEITNRIKNTKRILFVSYALSTIFSLLFLSGIAYKNIFNKILFANYWPEANHFTTAFVFLQILTVAYGLYILRKTISISSPIKKNQLKYLFAVSLLAWAGGLTNWFFWFKIPIAPIGNPFITIYLGVIAYAIIKHSLMDINFVIKKGLVYSILITIVSTIYFILAVLVESVFRGIVGYQSFPLTVFTVALLVLLFHPLKNRIQCIIDRFFFHGSIDQIDEENIKLRYEIEKTEKLKAIATLAAGMAHEIKNPLTSIKTFNEYLPERYTDPEFIQKFHRIVGGEVDRINHIVKQLLEFSKPSELSLKRVSITDLIEETLGLLSNDMIKMDIKVVRAYAENSIAMVDPSQMKQVFLNLLLNALDSMPREGGRLVISSEVTTEGMMRIEIEDNGKGIDPADQAHIFIPFFSRKDGGTGLGLSVVHGIIEKHGGSISVKSLPGRGATFSILLPQN